METRRTISAEWTISVKTELSLSSLYLLQALPGLTLSPTDVGKGTCNEGILLKAEFPCSAFKTEEASLGRAGETEQN